MSSYVSYDNVILYHTVYHITFAYRRLAQLNRSGAGLVIFLGPCPCLCVFCRPSPRTQCNHARQHRTRHGETRQSKAGQGRAGQGRSGQGRAGPGGARRGEARRGEVGEARRFMCFSLREGSPSCAPFPSLSPRPTGGLERREPAYYLLYCYYY